MKHCNKYLMVSSLLLTFCWIHRVNGNPCSPCSCHRLILPYKRICIVDCRNLRLTSVPTFPLNQSKTFTSLHLNFNAISNIPEGAFDGLQMLENLYLQNNTISTISEGAFDGLPMLKFLNLSNNQISNIPKGLFNGLQTLELLYLQNNLISNISEGAFGGLRMLEKLYLQNNQISNISEGAFGGLRMLEKLYLQNNQISNISEGAFGGLQMLKFLNLSLNLISNIPEGAFDGLRMLENLYLQNNQISNISEGAFGGLRMLKFLDLSDNQISSIPQGAFNGLSMLGSLNLYGNQIKTLSPRVFQTLGELMIIWLDNNRIFTISKDSFKGLVRLNILYLDNNPLQSLRREAFTDLLSLEKLYLSNNRISSIDPDTFLRLGNLKLLQLNSTGIRNVPEAFWITPLSDVTLNMEYNSLRCSCKLINELKQLNFKVKRLEPTVTQYVEEHCKDITLVCEEERNFALGMSVSDTCDVLYRTYMYNVTDGNTNNRGRCYSDVFCNVYIRINLPGVIVVTNVIMTVRIRHIIAGIITVEVGDKLSDQYTPCNNFTLASMSGRISVNSLCVTTPSGRDVRVTLIGCKKRSIVDFYEVIVNGYEKTKYNLWSNWDQWGPCSKSCGSGFRLRRQNCTNTTSLKCLLPNSENQRALVHYDQESCNLKPCFQAVYQWTIGCVTAVFILTIFAIVFWYRKFKMITYFDGLRPNPNFQMDPNRTLLEQIEDLPYDLHWEFPRYDIRFGSVLGEGHFGRVWLAKAKGIKAFNPHDRSDLSSRAKLAKLQDQRVHDYFTTVTEAWILGDCDTTHHYDVAVKTLKECATPQHKMDLASELKLLIYMGQNPNIVNVLASCTIRGDLWVIMEYCDHGDLKKFLSDRRNRFTPFWSKQSADISNELCLFDLLHICEQIVKGVMFLHCWNVVHRDLAARNILVDGNFNVKIADFGLARSNGFIASADDIMPIKWSSLESLLRHEYTTKSDIWSVGVLLWEVFSLSEMPYPGMTSREVIQQLKEGYRMDPPDHCPPEVSNIISDCWNIDPELRPSAMQLFEQLDEVKVVVCSAPNGQYYGTDGEYGQAGTVEGPSLDEIIHLKHSMAFDTEESTSKAVIDIHRNTSESDIRKCEQYRQLEADNFRLNNILHTIEQVIKRSAIEKELMDEIEFFKNNHQKDNSELASITDIGCIVDNPEFRKESEAVWDTHTTAETAGL